MPLARGKERASYLLQVVAMYSRHLASSTSRGGGSSVTSNVNVHSYACRDSKIPMAQGSLKNDVLGHGGRVAGGEG